VRSCADSPPLSPNSIPQQAAENVPHQVPLHLARSRTRHTAARPSPVSRTFLPLSASRRNLDVLAHRIHRSRSRPLDALVRHFSDLRDSTHAGHASRQAKEAAFRAAVPLLDAPARQVLDEFDRHLLLGTGTIHATGPQRDRHGGSFASWQLSRPEQRGAGIDPITLYAHYGAGFHHPHLRGATVAEWPLNVFTAQQAAGLVPVLRAIAAADVDNLVFQRDWSLVPALRPDGAASASSAEGK
jgi:hypothetical protein